MADAVQTSCAAPVVKRPRLDYSPCKGDTMLSLQPVQHVDNFRKGSERKGSSNVASSNVHQLDHSDRNTSCREISSSNDIIIATDFKPSTNQEDMISYDSGIAEPTSSSMHHKVQNGSTPHHENGPEEIEAEDPESTISDLSGLSDLSNISDNAWMRTFPTTWVHTQMLNGMDPRMILQDLVSKDAVIPPNWNDTILWRIIVNLLSDPRRTKLSHINTLDDAIHLLKTCKKIVVLTGAGVSVSCGIPDFRSKDGIYARLRKDYPDLPNPQAMFNILYFRKDPRPFFKFAKEIYPGQFKPSPSHHFINLLEKKDKLLRNYTQNIDTLEHAAGIKNVITCHGSFATASCTMCRYKVESSVIKEDIFSQRIPYCPMCPAEVDPEDRGIMKPDIVFFGEGLSEEFYDAMANDKDVCDLLIVIGSSLKVRPVSTIPSSIPANVPQILINREPLKHLVFDIELLGDCDVIIGELCKRLEQDWTIEESIPRSTLNELTTLPSSKHCLKNCNPTDNCEASPIEMNNNDSSESDVMQGSSSDSSEWGSNLPQSEESNSCDCRGLSAIRLEDSEDGSNQEQQNGVSDGVGEDAHSSQHAWPSRMKESLSKRLPDASYLFVPPCRYIFQGAEIYKESETDGSSSTSTENSSDSESPCLSSDDEDDDNADPETVTEVAGSSQTDTEQSPLNEQGVGCVQKLSGSDKNLSNCESKSPNTSLIQKFSLV